MSYLMIFILTTSMAAAIVAYSSTKENDLHVSAEKGMVHLRGERSMETTENDGGKRRRRSAITILDGPTRSDVLSFFNGERSLVGASDMPYVNWSYQLEDAAINWTSRCNYDAPFYGPNETYLIKANSPSDYTPAQVLADLFNNTDFYNAVRSIYVTGVCGVRSLCAPANATGLSYARLNIYAFVFPTTIQFNSFVQQYTPGTACSRCQTGVNWCYNKLCRGDCDLNTSGCCPITNGSMVGQCATTPAPLTTTPAATAFNSSVIGGNSASNFEFTRTAMLLGLLMSILFKVVE